ncbi:MAG TPA: peptidase domain-containing ABC transporter, partial [Methylotenera sp.]|nr:peptidase domain-containing ABC transporter [Methylotenera sp.]
MAKPLHLEAFVWATGVLCQLNRIPHDTALLIKQYPPPYDIVNLQQALQSFGLNNSLKQYTLNQLPNASLPCLAILKPSVIPEATSSSSETL